MNDPLHAVGSHEAPSFVYRRRGPIDQRAENTGRSLRVRKMITSAAANGHVMKPAAMGRFSGSLHPPKDGGEGEPFASSTHSRSVRFECFLASNCAAVH